MRARLVVLLSVGFFLLPGCNCGEGPGNDGGTADGGTADGGTADSGPPCGVALDETALATLYVTADDEADVYINGAFVATQAVPWNANALERTIQVNRNPTRPNVVAVLAHNVYALGLGQVDRGMLLDFRLGDAGVADAPRIFVSGAGWRVLNAAPDAGAEGLTDGGWTRLDFDDAQWALSVAQLPYGAAPYGNVFSPFGIDSSGAWWMWAYDSALAASKPTAEEIYFRHVFYFALDGGFSDAGAACP